MKLHYKHNIQSETLKCNYNIDMYLPKAYNPYRSKAYALCLVFNQEISTFLEFLKKENNIQDLIIANIEITENEDRNEKVNIFQVEDYDIVNEFDENEKIFGLGNSHFVYIKKNLLKLIYDNYHVRSTTEDNYIFASDDIAGLFLKGIFYNNQVADKYFLENPIIIEVTKEPKCNFSDELTIFLKGEKKEQSYSRLLSCLSDKQLFYYEGFEKYYDENKNNSELLFFQKEIS